MLSKKTKTKKNKKKNYKTLNHMAANWNMNKSTHLMVVTLLMQVGAGG